MATKEQLVVQFNSTSRTVPEGNLLIQYPNARFVYNQYLIAMGTTASGIWLIPEMVMIGTEDGSETGDAQELVDHKTIMQNDPKIYYRYLGRMRMY